MTEANTDKLITRETKAITASTTVNIAMVIGIVGVIWSGAQWATRMEAKLDHSVQLLELKIDQVQADIRERTLDRWTRSDAQALHERISLWSARLSDLFEPGKAPVFPAFPTAREH